MPPPGCLLSWPKKLFRAGQLLREAVQQCRHIFCLLPPVPNAHSRYDRSLFARATAQVHSIEVLHIPFPRRMTVQRSERLRLVLQMRLNHLFRGPEACFSYLIFMFRVSCSGSVVTTARAFYLVISSCIWTHVCIWRVYSAPGSRADFLSVSH